jgi:RNA polymerase sigma factor (sigma-70 family)
MPARPESALHLVRAAAAAAGLGQRTDPDLLAAFLAGEAAAFEALVRRHGPMVLRTCRAATRCEADAEDAFQTTFVLLYRQAAGVRDRRSLSGWLFRVARRSAANARRAADRRGRREAAVERPTTEAPTDLSWREACSVLHAEIDRLPETYRLPLVLCHLRGLSRDEAAHQLGWSLNEVRGRLERGRSQLRKRLEKRGIALSAGLFTAVAAEALPPTLVRAAVAAAVRPSTRVAELATAMTGTLRLKAAAGFAVAAALVVAVGVGADGLRAGPMPSKEMPSKPATKADADPNPATGEAPERLTLSGRVLDPDGKPAAGAKVWLLVQFGISPRNGVGPKVVGTTDAEGRFAVDDDGRGRSRNWTGSARLVATADGFGLAWADAAKAADKPVELRLVKDEPIRGRILTLEGKPVAGARVRVQEVSAPAGPDLTKFVADLGARNREWHSVYGEHFHYEHRLFQSGYPVPGQPEAVETDADGRFRITGLGGERLAQLRVEGPTVTTAELSVLTRPIDILTVPEHPGDSRYGTYTYRGSAFDYAAEPTQPFEGVVTDRQTGQPVAGARVRGHNHRLQLETVADRDGHYRLTGLPPGPHELIAIPTADQPYHRMAASGGRAASSRPAAVDFPLTRGHWVTGKLVNARTGKPEAGAPIWYHPLADEPAYEAVPGSQAWVHEPTTFTAADGSFRVIAFACRGAVVANGFSGQYLGADQRPLQGDANSLDPGMRSPTDIPASPVVNLGSYNGAAIVSVDPKKPKEYTITLDPGVTVPVTVVDPDGKPAAGAGVGGLSTWSLWAPNQKAAFELKQYNPDRPRSLVFLHPDRGLGKLVEPKAGDVGPWEVRLEPTGTVTGRLVTEDGKPVANAVLRVYYLKPGNDAWSPSFAHQQARTDADGRFRLTNLVGGLKYSIDHKVQKGTTRQDYYRNVRVKAGETKDLGDIKPAGGD